VAEGLRPHALAALVLGYFIVGFSQKVYHIMSELDFDDIASMAGSSTVPDVETPGSSSKSKKGRNSVTGDGAGAGSGMCLMPKCDLDQKKNNRWCPFHCTHNDNLRHYMEFGKPDGSKAKREAWVEKMKDHEPMSVLKSRLVAKSNIILNVNLQAWNKL
jgi:hypothetical protein